MAETPARRWIGYGFGCLALVCVGPVVLVVVPALRERFLVVRESMQARVGFGEYTYLYCLTCHAWLVRRPDEGPEHDPRRVATARPDSSVVTTGPRTGHPASAERWALARNESTGKSGIQAD